jgi:DNA helicase-2/ATP-dependent DNA helicase PcrA
MNNKEYLNNEQLNAVETTEGFVRVIAGAGSGKTRALTRRFAYLVNEIGVIPSNILCVTFTNKSANEMRQRIRNLTGDNDTGYICTFHSFCVSVLQEEAHAVAYPESFLVLDNSDIDSILAIIYEERKLTLRDKTFSDARDMIEMQKLRFKPDYYKDMIAMPLDILRQKYNNATATDDIIFYGYLYQEKKCFGLDYNDLLKFTLYIFEQNPEICRKWQERLEYIMIDEFQDIDEIQYKLMKVLCGYHGNIFVVGDPDQTIYTWRGASVKYLLDFDKEFKDTKTIMMMENYRSTPEILAVANDLISQNVNRIKKELFTQEPSSEKPVYYHAKNSDEEFEWIAKEVESLKANGINLSDIAILYRSHFVTRKLEEVFLKKNIPYMLYSGIQFYDRAEIKDALAYMRMIVFKDDLSFMRIVNRPKRNIGEQRIKFLQEYADKNKISLFESLKKTIGNEIFKNTKATKFISLIEDFQNQYGALPISEFFSSVMEKSGYEEMLRTEGSGERLDNLAELKQSMYEYETTCGEETNIASYLSHIALFSNIDTASKENAVKCMTVHSAKGLEFRCVFICSLEEGVFPAKKTATKEAMEEERRLAFVAFTRAREKLYFSDSEGKNFDGSFRFPSRFIVSLDNNLINIIKPLDDKFLSDAKEKITWSEKYLLNDDDKLFAVGDNIVHPVMGKGKIIGMDDKRKAYIIKFDILNTNRFISYHVKLSKETI